MPHSLRVKLKNLQRKGELTDKDIDRIFKALEQEPRCPFYKIDEDGHGLCMNHRYMEDVLGKIRAEIDKWHHLTDKAFNDGIDTALEIIDKYKVESEDKE